MFLQFMNSHFHSLISVELATFQVWLLQWPIQYGGWCATSQWNNYYISWFWRGVWGCNVVRKDHPLQEIISLGH